MKKRKTLSIWLIPFIILTCFHNSLSARNEAGGIDPLFPSINLRLFGKNASNNRQIEASFRTVEKGKIATLFVRGLYFNRKYWDNNEKTALLEQGFFEEIPNDHFKGKCFYFAEHAHCIVKIYFSSEEITHLIFNFSMLVMDFQHPNRVSQAAGSILETHSDQAMPDFSSHYIFHSTG